MAGAGLVLCLAACLAAHPGDARAEPPILNPQDAFCRSEARAQVFSAPDPLNLGLREIGRRIWASCMERGKGGGAGKEAGKGTGKGSRRKAPRRHR